MCIKEDMENITGGTEMTIEEIEAKLMELLGPDGDFSWHHEHRYNKKHGWWDEQYTIMATIPVGKCEHCDSNRTEFIGGGLGKNNWADAWEYFLKQYKKLSEGSLCPTR